jgi:DivIVA domain-containing protein
VTVTLSAQDVRDARFGTTRVRAGYKMSEVDEFLDRIEAAIGQYAEDKQRMGDEADVLRSQVQQLQGRLAAVQQELQELHDFQANAAPETEQTGHDTVITPLPDTETTAENPVVAPARMEPPKAQGNALTHIEQLVEVRDRVREMLQHQLSIVDEMDLEPRVDSSASSSTPTD